MFFRERGNAIQLVRSHYDAERQRAKQEVVGRVPRRGLKLENGTLEKLTETERAEFGAYVDRVKNIDQLRLKLAAHDLPRIVSDAVRYAAEVSDDAERDALRQLFADAVVRLRQASAKELRSA